jgi:hypothetical protein
MEKTPTNPAELLGKLFLTHKKYLGFGELSFVLNNFPDKLPGVVRFLWYPQGVNANASVFQISLARWDLETPNWADVEARVANNCREVVSSFKNGARPYEYPDKKELMELGDSVLLDMGKIRRMSPPNFISATLIVLIHPYHSASLYIHSFYEAHAKTFRGCPVIETQDIGKKPYKVVMSLLEE